MAAKKAPAKKMAAPKAAAKKTGSAAQFRKAEEAGKAKAYNKPASKDQADARGRASKYGTPVGPTSTSRDDKPFASRPNTRYVKTDTIVKSSRGNRFLVSERKIKKPMGRDEIDTRVSSAQFPSRKTRAAKFGPAPKKKK
jgi:hypothetical protein